MPPRLPQAASPNAKIPTLLNTAISQQELRRATKNSSLRTEIVTGNFQLVACIQEVQMKFLTKIHPFDPAISGVDFDKTIA